jgi:hypothetical protein
MSGENSLMLPKTKKYIAIAILILLLRVFFYMDNLLLAALFIGTIRFDAFSQGSSLIALFLILLIIKEFKQTFDSTQYGPGKKFPHISSKNIFKDSIFRHFMFFTVTLAKMATDKETNSLNRFSGNQFCSI